MDCITLLPHQVLLKDRRESWAPPGNPIVTRDNPIVTRGMWCHTQVTPPWHGYPSQIVYDGHGPCRRQEVRHPNYLFHHAFKKAYTGMLNQDLTKYFERSFWKFIRYCLESPYYRNHLDLQAHTYAINQTWQRWSLCCPQYWCWWWLFVCLFF